MSLDYNVLTDDVSKEDMEHFVLELGFKIVNKEPQITDFVFKNTKTNIKGIRAYVLEDSVGFNISAGHNSYMFTKVRDFAEKASERFEAPINVW